MNIHLIACIADNNAIGKDGHCIYRIPQDRQRLHRTIQGNTVILGRKTYETMPQTLLQACNTIVVSSSLPPQPHAQVYRTFSAALTTAQAADTPYIYVLGGADIFYQAMDYATTLHLTIVHDKPAADTFFPEIPADVWQSEWKSDTYTLYDEKRGKNINYHFAKLVRNTTN